LLRESEKGGEMRVGEKGLGSEERSEGAVIEM